MCSSVPEDVVSRFPDPSIIFDTISLHDLHIWSLSSNEAALSCHVCLEEKDFQKGPDLIEQINVMLIERFKIGHGTIQLEKDTCARSDLLCRHSDHHWE